jgi:hypothetical protein
MKPLVSGEAVFAQFKALTPAEQEAFLELALNDDSCINEAYTKEFRRAIDQENLCTLWFRQFCDLLFRLKNRKTTTPEHLEWYRRYELLGERPLSEIIGSSHPLKLKAAHEAIRRERKHQAELASIFTHEQAEQLYRLAKGNPERFTESELALLALFQELKEKRARS